MLFGLTACVARSPGASAEERGAPQGEPAAQSIRCPAEAQQPWHVSLGPAMPVSLSEPQLSVRDGVAVVVGTTYSLSLDVARGEWADVTPIPPRLGAEVISLADGGTLRLGGRPFGLSATTGAADVVTMLESEAGWSDVGALVQARSYPAGIEQPDGSILIGGGESSKDERLSSVERWDRNLKKSRLVAPMHAPRSRHRFVPLGDGRVLAIGGQTGQRTQAASTERYDPVTDAWSITAPLPGGDASYDAIATAGGHVFASSSAAVFVSRDEAQSWQPISTVRPASRIFGRSDCDAWLVGGLGVQSLAPDSARPLWLASPSLWRQQPSAVAIDDDTVLVLGGMTLGDADRVTEVWRRTSTTPAPLLRWSVPRERARVYPDRLIGVAHTSPGQTVILRSGGVEVFDGARRKDERRTEGEPLSRWGQALATLDDGSVLVVGGVSGGTDVAEREDPQLGDSLGGAQRLTDSTSTWSPVAAPPLARWGARLVALPGGDAALLGGVSGDGMAKTILRRDGASGRWSPATSRLSVPRLGHTSTAVEHGVLSVGSCDVVIDDPAQTLHYSAGNTARNTELWDPKADRVLDAGGLATPRCGHTAVVLRDGRVLVAGGFVRGTITAWAQLNGEARLRATEIWDPKTRSWSIAAPLTDPRANAAALVLSDGSVLIVGGDAPTPDRPPTAEHYDPQTGTWSIVGTLPRRWEHVELADVGDGRILLAADNVTLDIFFATSEPDPQ